MQHNILFLLLRPSVLLRLSALLTLVASSPSSPASSQRNADIPVSDQIQIQNEPNYAAQDLRLAARPVPPEITPPPSFLPSTLLKRQNVDSQFLSACGTSYVVCKNGFCCASGESCFTSANGQVFCANGDGAGVTYTGYGMTPTNVPTNTPSSNSSPDTSSSSSSSVPTYVPVVAAIVGVIVIIALGVTIYFWRKTRKNTSDNEPAIPPAPPSSHGRNNSLAMQQYTDPKVPYNVYATTSTATKTNSSSSNSITTSSAAVLPQSDNTDLISNAPSSHYTYPSNSVDIYGSTIRKPDPVYYSPPAISPDADINPLDSFHPDSHPRSYSYSQSIAQSMLSNSTDGHLEPPPQPPAPVTLAELPNSDRRLNELEGSEAYIISDDYRNMTVHTQGFYGRELAGGGGATNTVVQEHMAVGDRREGLENAQPSPVQQAGRGVGILGFGSRRNRRRPSKRDGGALRIDTNIT